MSIWEDICHSIQVLSFSARWLLSCECGQEQVGSCHRCGSMHYRSWQTMSGYPAGINPEHSDS